MVRRRFAVIRIGKSREESQSVETSRRKKSLFDRCQREEGGGDPSSCTWLRRRTKGQLPFPSLAQKIRSTDS